MAPNSTEARTDATMPLNTADRLSGNWQEAPRQRERAHHAPLTAAAHGLAQKRQPGIVGDARPASLELCPPGVQHPVDKRVHKRANPRPH